MTSALWGEEGVTEVVMEGGECVLRSYKKGMVEKVE